MKYMGSKSRIKKEILPILQDIIETNKIETYIEPFCGGCNVIDDIIAKNRIASDLSEPLIELFKHIKNGGGLLDEVTKELYDDVRKNKDNDKYPKWIIGNVGYLASYNGRYFDGGYAKTLTSKTGKVRNYYDEAKRNIEKQIEKIKGVDFENKDYSFYEKENIEKALIYCDIPYKGTKQYSTSKNFDYQKFYEWARAMSEKNIIIISEENMPNDFECIWSQEITRTQDNNKRTKSIEKLFTIIFKK